jgi:hypothetical protein
MELVSESVFLVIFRSIHADRLHLFFFSQKEKNEWIDIESKIV